MRKLCSISLVVLLLLSLPALARLGSDKTMYVGGTVGSIKDGAEGRSSTKNDKVFVFEYEGGKLTIPYDQINDLEYGQKVGRRVGAAVAISPLLLFSKKRRHFLTIGFTDENQKPQAAVFELGKGIVRVTIASLEARTGKKVDFQDDEARKSGMGAP